MTSAVICGLLVSSCTSCYADTHPSMATVAWIVAGNEETTAILARYENFQC